MPSKLKKWITGDRGSRDLEAKLHFVMLVFDDGTLIAE